MRSPFGAWAQSASMYHVPLGQAAPYGLLSGGSIIARDAAGNDLSIKTIGKVGASGGVGARVAATAGLFTQGGGTVPQALNDLRTAQAYCDRLNSQAQQLMSQLAGRTLTQGVYYVGSGAVLGQGSTLTISGDTTTQVIINVQGDLLIEANSRVIVAGVLPQHIYWNIAGSLRVAGEVVFMGNALVSAPTTIDGIQFGNYAILSQNDIALTNISPIIGHNQFYAPVGTRITCTGSLPCAFNLPGTEMIKDGSFEVNKCNPQGISELIPPSAACFWVSATPLGTTDYFHEDGASTVSVPQNLGTLLNGITPVNVPALAQNSRATTGKAYAGVYAYATQQSAPYAEYACQYTLLPLQAGKRYYGEFSAHIAPGSGYTAPQLGMAVAPFGASTYPTTTSTSPSIIQLAPVVSGSPNLPLAPGATHVTPGWQRIGQVFTPSTTITGPIVYIGNFGAFTGTPNGPSTANTSYDFSKTAYYYIDNASLSPLTEAGTNTTLACSQIGQGIVLGTTPMPDVVDATYIWTESGVGGTLSANNVVNPTARPAVTTTYTLAVKINGVTYPPSQVTITVPSNGYQQNAAATYVAPTGLAPYEIGTYGTVTTLSATGGTLVFDGRYHVRGTVHLTRGDFELRPGTVFFVDGPSGLPASSGSDTYQTTLVVQGATLQLSGATLQTACSGQQWGGVWLDGRGTIRTEAASSARSQISGAQTGISSRAGNEYYLANTDFSNNDVGLYELASDKAAQPNEGAIKCVFQGGRYGILLAEGDYQNGPLYGGDYDAAAFSGNTFSDITYFGIYATAGRGHFTNNTFRTCGWAAMAAWNAPRIGPAEFQANHITVPASGTVQTQYGGPEGVFSADHSLLLTDNTIEGAPAPLSTTGSLRLGIDFLQSPDGGGTDQITGNIIRNLDEGFASLTNDYYGANITIKKNSFVNNAADIVFYPWGNQNLGATVTATIRCNSFINDANSTVSDPVGIWLKDMAVITIGLNTSANGNEFPAYWTGAGYKPLVNDNLSFRVSNRLDYMYFSQSLNENVRVSGQGVSISSVNADLSSPLNACGGTAPGVNNRQYQPGVLPLSVATLLTKLDSLSRIGLPAARQDQLLKSIRSQPAQAIHLPILEARLTVPGTMTLPNQLAIGLQLLEYYRAQHDRANTSRLLGWLRQRTPTNDELKAYLNLTEATDQMSSFLPGLRPLAATSRTLLSQAAASGTTSARAACRLLRAYEPACTCVLLASPATATRPTASPAQATALAAHSSAAQLLTAYPNPAGTTLHVPYTLPLATGAAQLLAYDALGRVVLRQELLSPQGEAEVSVQSWPAGLYQLTLVLDGQVQRQQRIVVTH